LVKLPATNGKLNEETSLFESFLAVLVVVVGRTVCGGGSGAGCWATGVFGDEDELDEECADEFGDDTESMPMDMFDMLKFGCWK
jgi:hypothetical protein